MGDPLAPGRQVGKYQVIRRLAAGGMAEIYLARATGLEGFRKEVVLKCLLPQLASRQEFVRQFLDEARLAATLDHPNVATIFDIGQIDGTYFLAMEYLNGEDLGVVLWALEELKRPFPLEHALTIATGIAAGLHHAHDKRGSDGQPLGIVHRDVSPSNVVVTYDGGVKLVDFGIAKATARGGTESGAIKGKLGYMSPEQGAGERLDRRSDVFALASVLYEMTTQHRLFAGDNDAQVLRQVLAAEVVPPSQRAPNYPRELEAVLLKALRRDPADRYATAREFQLALEGFARDRGVPLSQAALGGWLEETVRGSVTAGPAAAVAPTTSPNGATRVMSNREVAHALEGLPLPAPDASPSPGEARGAPVTRDVTRPAGHAELDAASRTPITPPATGRKGVFLGVGVALAASGVAIALALRPAPAPQAAAPVLLVAERGQVAVDGTTVAAAPVPPPPVAPAPDATVAAEAPAGAPARPHAPSAARRSAVARPQTESFSSTFARRERELVACATADPSSAARAGAALQVRFQIDEAGHVTSADLTPPELSDSRLGQCVLEVARSTRFAAQPQPLAFRIPVTVRRLGGSDP